MKKIIFFTLILSLFSFSFVYAYSDDTATANANLKKYLKEYKSPTANKTYLISCIGGLNTKKAEDALIKLLNTNKYLIMDEIIYQLGRLKSRKAVPKIIKALTHDSTRVRSTALSSLCDIKEKNSAKALMNYLKNAGDGSYYAAKALLVMNIKEAFPLILSNIVVPGGGVSADLIYSLPQDASTSDFKIKVKELLNDADSDVRIMAISMLGVFNDVTTAKDIALLLKDKDDRVREKAAYVLGDIKDKATLKDLINSLSDKSNNVKKEALYSLNLFKDKSIEPYVEKILFSDNDPQVKIAAAYTLGFIKSENSVNALIKAINIDDSEVQIQVVKSLGNLSNYRKAKSALMRLLYHRDNTIRQEAKSALGVTPPAKEPN